MRKASITEAKNNLSALIDSLRAGSPVLILDRGRPVARLESVTAASESEQGGRLSRLVRDGIVRPRRGVAHRMLFSSQLPRANAGASVIDALIKERREGR
jgi:prevent-host-death family protein